MMGECRMGHLTCTCHPQCESLRLQSFHHHLPFSFQVNFFVDCPSSFYHAMSLTSNLLPPSTPARQLRNRSPQQPLPGFVLTGSDSQRRITRDDDETPSSCPADGTTNLTTILPVTNLTDPASKKRSRNEAGGESNSVDKTVSKKKKPAPKKVKLTQSKEVPKVVDVDQDSSGDEASETHPGKKGDVKELLKYFRVPKHKDNKTC
ncbi:uncharacterized protein MELLADRAFT_94992 [Melampsora larici-populina 98AG31]|uniref:Uncharacterized protein n=1 Tax=Melampsora larici-populina (strain 98AG31 / pathotype 3-4-7) TaxID=747676 RepID=F4S8Q9_MELLP|nr:uncharacterized protein MELLADRAFT_94992 [Melampsora larici-populina 98AG31]EGF98938.1 hypothetical protein MELLADRAFT_94992 [Melampsora larici-populina 98AG31]